jgi:hypothetical protein
MRINPNDYGNPQALGPESIDGDTVILTVHKVEEYSGGFRKRQIGITFAEFPDLVLYLNRTMLTLLANKLGNETTAWIRQRVPLEVIQVRNPETKQDVSRLYPVNEAQWDFVIAEGERAAQPKASVNKKRAGK